MRLHWQYWQSQKSSLHGDMVEQVAPCGRYLIKFGRVPGGDYFVACCDHISDDLPLWEFIMSTEAEAKDYAEHLVEREALHAYG
jgi:hypothetical protein